MEWPTEPGCGWVGLAGGGGFFGGEVGGVPRPGYPRVSLTEGMGGAGWSAMGCLLIIEELDCLDLVGPNHIVQNESRRCTITPPIAARTVN